MKYPNLGSRLDDLVASVEAGQATAQEAAEEAAVYSGASVAVTIYLSGSVAGVVAFLEENGGDPRNVGEDYVEAYVPVTLLGPVSDRPGVIRVREIVPPEPGAGRVAHHRPARAVKRPVPGNDARSGKGSRQRDVVGTTTRRIVEMMRPCSDRGIFRFLAIATLAALVVTLAVALPGVSADGGEDGKRDDYSHDQAPPIPDKGELNYPNLGSHLDQLVTSVEEGQATSLDAAGYTPAHSEESVAVTIYLSGNVDDVVTFLEENGGDPRNVGEDYIEAYVPVTLLGQLSEQPGVVQVREIAPPQPAQTMQQIIGHGPGGAWLPGLEPGRVQRAGCQGGDN